MWHDYTKRPVTIQAVLLDEDNVYAVSYDLMAHRFHDDPEDPAKITGLRIATLEGNMVANLGDYVIKGIQGEFYPCRADIFEATYENPTHQP